MILIDKELSCEIVSLVIMENTVKMFFVIGLICPIYIQGKSNIIFVLTDDQDVVLNGMVSKNTLCISLIYEITINCIFTYTQYYHFIFHSKFLKEPMLYTKTLIGGKGATFENMVCNTMERYVKQL